MKLVKPTAAQAKRLVLIAIIVIVVGYAAVFLLGIGIPSSVAPP